MVRGRIPRPALIAGEGKVGLFKSLKGLSGADLRYAIGYNMSTLRMFGVPLAGVISLPYDIQQTINTFKRFSQSATRLSPTPALRRASTLGFARNVIPAARRAVPRTGLAPIDRYSSLYFGRMSKNAIRKISKGEGKGAALKAAFNPVAVDKEIQRQSKIPGRNNVLQNWQLGTYMRAVTGAPDPISNNPFRQAIDFKNIQKQKRNAPVLNARYKILDSKGEHAMMSNARFDEVMGGLENATFINPEQSIKGAMDGLMMNYMTEQLAEFQSGKPNLTVFSSHRSARKDRLQGYLKTTYDRYASAGIDSSIEAGLQHSGTTMSESDFGLTRLMKDKSGFTGYANENLKNIRAMNMLDSTRYFDGSTIVKDNRNPFAGFHEAFTADSKRPELVKVFTGGALKDERLGGAIDDLARALGVNSINATSPTRGFHVMGIIDILTTVAHNSTVSQTNPMGGVNKAVSEQAIHIKAINNFVKDLDALGYKSTAESIAGMMINPKEIYKAAGSAPGNAGQTQLEFDAPIGTNKGMLQDMEDYYMGVPRNGTHVNPDSMQGTLLKARQDTLNKAFKFEGAGGTFGSNKGDGTMLNEYFYSPNMNNALAYQGMLHYLEGDDFLSGYQGKKYFKSYGSMRYHLNKTKQRLEMRKKMGLSDRNELFTNIIAQKDMMDLAMSGKLDSEFPGLASIMRERNRNTDSALNLLKAKFPKEYEKIYFRAVQKASRHGHIESKPGVTVMGKGGIMGSGQVTVGGGNYIYNAFSNSFKSADEAYPGDHIFANALKYGQAMPAPQSGSFFKDSFVGKGPGVHKYLRPIHAEDIRQHEREIRKSPTKNRPGGDNYIPNKMDIVKSIHMIPLNSKMATSGPYLFQAVVVAGTSKPVRNRPADLIRDISAIEYGGPATDSSGGLARRSDGMYFLPSFFFTRAAEETAAYLGLSAGQAIKSTEKSVGRELTMRFNNNNPNYMRMKTRGKQQDKFYKDLKTGMERMAASERNFARRQRDRAKLLGRTAMAMASRRALRRFSEFDPESPDQTDLISPESVMTDVEDTYVLSPFKNKGLSQEFNPLKLGTVKRFVGRAGLGGGFAKNSKLDVFREIAPSQSVNVWNVDGEDILGRLPFVPVFDPSIYKKLIQNESYNNAKNYLQNAGRIIGDGYKSNFHIARAQSSATRLGGLERQLETVLGDKEYEILTSYLGKSSADVRRGMQAMMEHGAGVHGVVDIQTLFYEQGEGRNTYVGRMRDLFAGPKSRDRLAAHLFNNMKDQLNPVISRLNSQDKQFALEKLKSYASGNATKIARGIETVWSNKGVGQFTTPLQVMTAIEKTAILLEQGMAVTADRAAFVKFLFQTGGRRMSEEAASILSVNKIQFFDMAKQLDGQVEAIVNSKITLDITDVGFDEIFTQHLMKGGNLKDLQTKMVKLVDGTWVPLEELYPEVGQLTYETIENRKKATKNKFRTTIRLTGDKVLDAQNKQAILDGLDLQTSEDLSVTGAQIFTFGGPDNYLKKKIQEFHNGNSASTRELPDLARGIGVIDGRKRPGHGVNVIDHSMDPALRLQQMNIHDFLASLHINPDADARGRALKSEGGNKNPFKGRDVNDWARANWMVTDRDVNSWWSDFFDNGYHTGLIGEKVRNIYPDARRGGGVGGQARTDIMRMPDMANLIAAAVIPTGFRGSEKTLSKKKVEALLNYSMYAETGNAKKFITDLLGYLGFPVDDWKNLNIDTLNATGETSKEVLKAQNNFIDEVYMKLREIRRQMGRF